MSNSKFKFRNTNEMAIGSGGYEVDHEKASSLTYTGLWRGNKVVALLVAKGSDSLDRGILKENGNFIVNACNSHAKLMRIAEKLVKFNKYEGLPPAALDTLMDWAKEAIKAAK